VSKEWFLVVCFGSATSLLRYECGASLLSLFFAALSLSLFHIVVKVLKLEIPLVVAKCGVSKQVGVWAERHVA